jgi:hypothetical protein
MLTPEDFNEMADALVAANGIDRALADNYVFLIGDTPELESRQSRGKRGRGRTGSHYE